MCINNPVSFGKIFEIRYRAGANTTQKQLDNHILSDEDILRKNYCRLNLQRIERKNNLISDQNSHLSSNGIIFFTDNSYKEYATLKNIDPGIANQYFSKEVNRLYIDV